jgi:hypothetical protein
LPAIFLLSIKCKKGKNLMKRIILVFAITAAFTAVVVPPTMAANPHFIGARSCTFSRSTGDLTCSFKVAGLGNVSTADVFLVFKAACTNRGGHNPPGQASTEHRTFPVRNGSVTLVNERFDTNVSCPDRMVPFAGPSATLVINGVTVGQIPIVNVA